MTYKTYIFKCGHKKGEHHCDGEHTFILTDESFINLIDRMIFAYKLKVDAELIYSTIKKYIDFIENKYVENQTGTPVFSHFTTMDIEAELLQEFTQIEFGILCFDELYMLSSEANNPNFDDNSKCHDWRNYVPEHWRENWFSFTEREREIIIFMATENADKEDWD